MSNILSRIRGFVNGFNKSVLLLLLVFTTGFASGYFTFIKTVHAQEAPEIQTQRQADGSMLILVPAELMAVCEKEGGCIIVSQKWVEAETLKNTCDSQSRGVSTQ